jgi:hypothetical protein
LFPIPFLLSVNTPFSLFLGTPFSPFNYHPSHSLPLLSLSWCFRPFPVPPRACAATAPFVMVPRLRPRPSLSLFCALPHVLCTPFLTPFFALLFHFLGLHFSKSKKRVFAFVLLSGGSAHLYLKIPSFYLLFWSLFTPILGLFWVFSLLSSDKRKSHNW